MPWLQDRERWRPEGWAPWHRQPSAPRACPHWLGSPPQTTRDRTPHHHCQPPMAPCPPEEPGPWGHPRLQLGETPPWCVRECTVSLSTTPALLGPGTRGHCLAQPQPRSAPAGCGIRQPGAYHTWPRRCLTRPGAPSCPGGAGEAGTRLLACPLASAVPQPFWRVSAAEEGQGGLCGQLSHADPVPCLPQRGR